jgi:hypothetical protein
LTYEFHTWRDGLERDVVATNDSLVSYRFNDIGNYTVYVIVRDALNESSTSESYTINVMPAPHRGGGGGGGGSSCLTNWTCSDWSACENGTMNRTCTLANSKCITHDAKPAESMACTPRMPEGNETKTGESKGIFGTAGKITGEVIGAVGKERMIGAAIFIAAVLTAGGLIWLARRKYPKARARKSRRN